jgi:acyl CoA:acetate/3-ketoacid CoA transferase
VIQILTPAAAAALIENGATVAASGGGYRAVPESMLKAIAARFSAEKAPADLDVVCVSMMERTRGGVGGEGTGLNRLAIPGLIRRLISSSFSRAPEREINQLIRSNAIAAYNYPMGTIIQWLRAIGAGRPGLVTGVGIGTFVDPRVEGGRTNAAAAEPLNCVVDFAGEESLFYPRLTIDVGLVRASAADERGNLYMDRQVYDHGSIDVAMAARACGGVVIAEVDRMVKPGELPARLVRIPGAMVNVVVVTDEAPWEDEQAPVLLGEVPVALPPPSSDMRLRDIIATLAVDGLPQGAVVNVGAGIPMYDVPEAARRLGRTDLYFTVEQGPMGGWPQVGGVSRNPEAVMSQLDVFDFYEGGGPDVSVLSFGEIDALGNVNVSRFANMMTGCGGFINIAHGVRHLIFCGTLTTGGLDLDAGEGELKILKEGRVRRFVERVEQITFSARHVLARGHRLDVVTERALFSITSEGYVLRAVAGGIDIRRDVLDLIPFPVIVPDHVMRLPERLYRSLKAA